VTTGPLAEAIQRAYNGAMGCLHVAGPAGRWRRVVGYNDFGVDGASKYL
jgi:hypothetical protein